MKLQLAGVTHRSPFFSCDRSAGNTSCFFVLHNAKILARQSCSRLIEMNTKRYPDCIKALARARVPLSGVQAWVAQGREFQMVFFEIESGVQVAPHSHGEQFGYVFEGEMALTIGDDTRTYRGRDSYHIPAGVVHQAEFKTFVRVVDFFLEPDRYRTE
ncbi:MAG: hypothetical protein C4K48_12995 [Candidatus Thorarchaeota archaeon]|nr:MAG: hypothetical protein C4K48_12995 [Candidatus Thorarchaeota archaeon]